MMATAVGLLTLHFQLPGCSSLKQKRSLIKPVMARLHKEFNLSVAEVGSMDHWQESIIACVLVSNDHVYTQKALRPILAFFENHWPDLLMMDHHIEIL